METQLLKLRNSPILFCVALSSLIQLNAQTVNFDWAKKMGSNGNDHSMSIAIDASDNVYTTGWFQGTADFDPGEGTFNLSSAGQNDIFISKLDAAGNFVWAKQFGGSAFNDAGFSIAVDSNGNVYTTGGFNGTIDFDPGAGIFNLTSENWDVFISKLDSSGNFVWAKQAGGISSDEGYSVTADAYGNVYVYGRFNEVALFEVTTIYSGIVDGIFICKLDSSGNFLWAKATGGSWIGNIVNRTVAVNAGNVYITGEYNGAVDFDPFTGNDLTSSGGQDIFVAKYDTSGNFLWVKDMGGTLDDQGYTIALDSSGNIYTTGSFSGTVDFDPGAGIFNLTSAGQLDIFISKLNSSGNFVWAKKIGAIGIEEGLSIAIDPLGNLYTTGIFQGTVDFDPGAETFTVTSSGGYDIFVLQLDSSGNFAWAKKMGGAPTNVGTSIAVNASGSVFTTGIFYGTADFDPGTGTFNLISAGNSDIFVHKMSQGVVSINEPVQQSNIEIFPNPSNGKFTIEWVGEKCKVEICNVFGEKIYSSIINLQSSIINLDSPNGIYFISVKTENNSVTEKLIVQK